MALLDAGTAVQPPERLARKDRLQPLRPDEIACAQNPPQRHFGRLQGRENYGYEVAHATRTRLPDALNLVGVECSVIGDNWQIFCERLSDEQSVEGGAVD